MEYKIYKKILLPAVVCLLATMPLSVYADTLSIYFVGDLMQHSAQILSAKTPYGKYDYSKCFSYVKGDIRSADIAVGNLEVVLGGKPYTGYPSFSAPDEFLYAIRDAGFDVLMTANNHCLDRERRGLERTIGLLDSLRLKHAGTYVDNSERVHRYPLLVEKKGFKIVFLNATYGTNGIPVTSPNVVNYIDRNQMKKDILKARLMRPDAIIAVMHWGQEYKSYPSDSERELAEWLVSLGVTHVIGTHPHVVQPIELIGEETSPDKNLIVYSLGNYISNMSARNTDGGMTVKIVLKKSGGITRLLKYDYSFVWTSRPSVSGNNSYILYPCHIDRSLLNDSEKIRLERYLREAESVASAFGY